MATARSSSAEHTHAMRFGHLGRYTAFYQEQLASWRCPASRFRCPDAPAQPPPLACSYVRTAFMRPTGGLPNRHLRSGCPRQTCKGAREARRASKPQPVRARRLRLRARGPPAPGRERPYRADIGSLQSGRQLSRLAPRGADHSRPRMTPSDSPVPLQRPPVPRRSPSRLSRR
jgi:hypothetical protein